MHSQNTHNLSKKQGAIKKILAGAVSIAALAIFTYFFFFSAPAWTSGEPVGFFVASGQPLPEIAKNLKSAGLIRFKQAFLFLADFKDLDTKIKSGRYQLRKTMNLREVVNALAFPKQTEIKVTIPEGFSVRDIDERLSQMGLLLPGEFNRVAISSEGYLFPDTYFVFTLGFKPEDLVKKMRNNFTQKITSELQSAAKEKNRSLTDSIIMASIIEKEVRTHKDYAIVSGILWKRLDADWPLQADATLLYGKEIPRITAKTLAEESPYNTRKNRGLPSTPICNPGLKAIRAAIFPEESPYWFYLTDAEGNVHYAKTNNEHNENRRKYLQ